MQKPVSEKKWTRIRSEYMTSEIAYRALAQKYGVPFSALSRRAKAENWPELRRQHNDRVATELIQKIQTENVAHQYAHLINLQKSADKLVNLASAVMEDENSCRDQYGRYDPRRLRDLACAVRELLTITRNVYDLPSIQERSSMDIAAERLKLEQRKVEQADIDKNEGIEVVLKGEEMEDYGR